MGPKSSRLSVSSKLSLHGDCGGVDTLELSYTRPGCCCGGRRTRLIASFIFPSMDKEVYGPRKCAQMATVHVDKLARKDGETPVTVRCLVGRVSLLTKQMTLSELLQGLNRTTEGRQAVLSFTLAGLGLQVGAGKENQIRAAFFCNGRQLVEGGAEQASFELLFQYAMDGLQRKDDDIPVPEVDMWTSTSIPCPQVTPVPEVDLGTLTSIPRSEVTPVYELDLGTGTYCSFPEPQGVDVDLGTLTSIPRSKVTPVYELDLGTGTYYSFPEEQGLDVDLGKLTSIARPECTPVCELDLGTGTYYSYPEAQNNPVPEEQNSPVLEADLGTLNSIPSLEDDLGFATPPEHNFIVCDSPSGDDEDKDTAVISPEVVMEGVTSLPSLPQHDTYELGNKHTYNYKAGIRRYVTSLRLWYRVATFGQAVAISLLVYNMYLQNF